MPRSVRSLIHKCLHKGAITQEEHDKIIRKLDKAMEWIPCSERLPSDYVLFCDLDGDVYYGHRMDNKWWAEGCDDRIKNVIAWMPLPEPYHEQ